MKTFALALALASVEAHGYGYATPAYPNAYPTYATASTIPHTHYQASSYNSNYPYSSKSDPWGVNGTTKTVASSTVIDKSTWYSPYQQYSPVRIPYVPGNEGVTRFAKCDTTTNDTARVAGSNSTSGFSANIQFA